MPHTGLLAALVALALAVTAPSAAAMPVEPKNCGMMKSAGKRYQVKSDQIRCKKARRWTRRYLRSGAEPRRYTCRSYDASTALRFRCSRGKRVFFAIRR